MAAAAVASPTLNRFQDLASEEAASLEEVCFSAQAASSKWRQQQQQVLENAAQVGVQEIRCEQSAFEELGADFMEVSRLTQDASELRTESEILGEAIRKSIKDSGGRSAKAAEIRDAILAAWASLQEETRQAEELLEMNSKTLDLRADGLQRLLSVYKDRLGLDIVRLAPQTLQLTFTLIDATEEDYSVTLHSSDGRFQLQSCSHDSPLFEIYLEHFNQHFEAPAALPSFLCGLRQIFTEASKAAGRS
eukprot:TRINITY_DN6492_c0_g1_i1.p1 TRINITY_DN6492_c0_g1~~TRINITY_DN6492_c0_g1_i1.p1  ORF type:complete len:248 (-),score=63.43 TRINITY_DN6492_c0_g1_i1:164-907(-)